MAGVGKDGDCRPKIRTRSGRPGESSIVAAGGLPDLLPGRKSSVQTGPGRGSDSEVAARRATAPSILAGQIFSGRGTCLRRSKRGGDAAVRGGFTVASGPRHGPFEPWGGALQIRKAR